MIRGSTLAILILLMVLRPALTLAEGSSSFPAGAVPPRDAAVRSDLPPALQARWETGDQTMTEFMEHCDYFIERQ